MLKNNPFFILNIPMSASRREIASKAEEQSFYLDPNVCSEAQAILTNPMKRLEAEIGWFPGEDSNTVDAIREAIEKDRPIDTSGLGVIGQLNASLDSFSKSTQTPEGLVQSINAIDVYYDINDSETLCDEINEERKKAGIAPTDIDKVNDELQHVREKIRTTITDKLANYNDDDYIDVVLSIAESSMGNDAMSHGVVVDDVINQYELRMQPVIDEKTEALEKRMKEIKSTPSSDNKIRVKALISQLKQWDRYVQPLQLRTQAEGYAHIISQRIAREAREVAVVMHNDMHDINAATELTNALKSIFAEMPEFIEILDDDLKTLAMNRMAGVTTFSRPNNTAAPRVPARNNWNQPPVRTTPTTTRKSADHDELWPWLIRIGVIVLILLFANLGSGGSSDYSSGSSSSGSSSSSSTSTTESNSSSYKDPYEGLVEQTMPENEHKFVNTFGDNRPSQIIVENPTDYAYYMKFEDSSGKTVFAFFVRPQSTTPMYMGLGTFYLKWAAGTTWYGEKDLFGPDTVYKKDPQSWTFEADKYWTLTMQAVVNGNVHSNTIDPDDF